MSRILVLAALAIASVCADGDLTILHSPSSVDFTGTDRINQSLLKEVFTAALGYTVKTSKSTQSWNGLHIKDPFDLPEAVVSIAIEGVESLESSRGIRYPLNVDEGEETTWQAVRQRLEERDINNTLVRIHVGDGLDALGHSALGELKPNATEQSSLEFLDLKNEEDLRFIGEIQLLRAIANKIRSTITADSKSDIYWLVVSGLRPVIDLHGKDSSATKEAFSLLNKAITDLSTAFVDVYSGKVVIAAFTDDANRARNTRSIENSRVRRQEPQATAAAATSENPTGTSKNSRAGVKIEDINLAKKYNANYPAIFNIILWFGVIFLFSLIAICITIADMDPGRDSIIYRMTSNRMKKDN